MSYCVLDSYAKVQTPTAQFSQCTYVALAMFFTFVICGQLSGGHGNPIITLALLFNKGSNMNFLKCLIYIVSQYAGCFVGGAVGKFIIIQLMGLYIQLEIRKVVQVSI